MDYKTLKIVTIFMIFLGITQAKSEAQQVTVELIESNFEAGNPEALQKAVELENLMQKLGSGDCLGTLRRVELSKIGGECRQMAASQTITGKNQICPLLQDYFNCYDKFNECFSSENVTKIKILVFEIWETGLVAAAKEFVKNCPEYKELYSG